MTASAASAQTAPSNGNQATRQSSGSSASTKTDQRSPANLFANLLGLIGASSDDLLPPNAANLGREGLADGADPEDPDTIGLNDLALGPVSANPLADLIGWPGAAAAQAATTANAMAPSNAPATALPEGTADQAGVPLQGMTVLAQSEAADPSLVSDLKNPATASNTAGTASSLPPTAPDRDAVSVRYGETSEALADTDTTKPSRSTAYMAARPANWRSTTALATSGPSAPLSTSAPTQTAALQVAQNTATQRSPLVDSTLPAPRNRMALGERFSDASASTTEATAIGLGALGAPGQASQSHADSSGNGHDESMFAGATAPDSTDLDAPEEAFSLDAALESEETLEGAEFMSPQQLRHASMRVGEGTDEALDIQLSMEGDAVNVAFRTDNAEVRSGLQNNAGASLSDILQRGGIQLGAVSVEAQSQQPRGESGESESESAPARVGASAGRNALGQGLDGAAGANTPTKAPNTRRSDGGPALDVFA